MNLTKLFNSKYPIIGGAMANICTGKFAAVISNAGGLGTIAAGGLNKEKLHKEIKDYKEASDKPFAVNIVMLSRHVDDLAQVVIEEEVPVVITGAGNPSKYISAWKEAGIVVIPVVPNPTLAKRMEQLGVDAVIAEGNEAGGHVGEMTTMTLVPQVVAEVSIPVIAAGGIASGKQMFAAEILGASGVQVGTSLLVADECPIHDKYKEKVLKAKDTNIVVIGRINGYPNRVIKNKMTRHFIEMEKAGTDKEELELFTMGAGKRAVFDGDIDEGNLMAGLVVGQLKETKPAAQILDDLYADYEAVKEKARRGEFS